MRPAPAAGGAPVRESGCLRAAWARPQNRFVQPFRLAWAPPSRWRAGRHMRGFVFGTGCVLPPAFRSALKTLAGPSEQRSDPRGSPALRFVLHHAKPRVRTCWKATRDPIRHGATALNRGLEVSALRVQRFPASPERPLGHPGDTRPVVRLLASPRPAITHGGPWPHRCIGAERLCEVAPIGKMSAEGL